MEDRIPLPHRLTLTDRKELALTGITEVVHFDDSTVVLKTQLGTLAVQGRDLLLKSLSPEGGNAAVSGHIVSLVYEEPRAPGLWQRMFG